MDLTRATEYPDSATELRLTGGVWHHLPRTNIDVLPDPSAVGAPVTIVWRTDPSTGAGFWDVSSLHRLATYRRHRPSVTPPPGESAARTYVGPARVRDCQRAATMSGEDLPAALPVSTPRPQHADGACRD